MGLLFATGAAVRALFLFFPALDSDQAVIGLMGLHILKGEFPAFFWGEPYSGTLESFLAALLFFVFGVSRQTLALAPTLVSFGFLWAGWRLAREIFGERAGLIALTLLAVPPVLLSWNSVLPRGNYIENLLLGTLCLLLAVRLGSAALGRAAGRRLVVLGGGLAGFAWYMNFQSVHYLAASALYVGWRQRLGLVRALPLGLAAFVVGSLPFWVANLETGFASLKETHRYSGQLDVAEGLSLLLRQLPIVLGARRFTYTYEQVGVEILPLLAPLAGAVFGAGIAVGLTVVVRRRHPGMILALFCAIVPTVILVGGFTAGPDPRFLLPLYSALPILWAGSIAEARRWRPVIVVALPLLVVTNLYSHWMLAHAELERFAHSRAEDRQLLDFLRARGLSNLVAPNYWLSYRLTFDAREELLIATPAWREYPRSVTKFPPYIVRVMASSGPAYLFEGRGTVFQRTLRAAGVQYEVIQVGRFTVLHDFRPPAPGRSLSQVSWRATDDSAGHAFDRDPWTAWKGTEFQLDLGAVYRVNQVVLHLGDPSPDSPGFLVEGSPDRQRWNRLAELKEAVPGFYWTADTLRLEEHGRVALVSAPTPIRYLRILPRPAGQRWALAELFVFEDAPEGGRPLPLGDDVALEDARRWDEALSRYAARLLDGPADEPALLRVPIAARELRLAGWPAVYEFLSGRAPDRDLGLTLRFARRFHALAPDREAAWRRLTRILALMGDAAEAEAVEAAMMRYFSPTVAYDVQFGQVGRRVRFLGSAIEPPTVESGASVEIRLYWQLLFPLPRRFLVAVSVHDGEAVRLRHERRLLQDLSASGWRPGEIVRETYTLRIPFDLNPGKYSVRLGIWKPGSPEQLRVWRGWWPTAQQFVELGVLEVQRHEPAGVEPTPAF